MKRRYLAFLAAVTVLITGTSCGSGDSSSDNGPSAAETTVSTTAVTSAPAVTTEEVTEPPVPEIPPMDSPYKVLNCMDVEGAPAVILSCGNYVAVQTYSIDDNGKTTLKLYVADAVNDKLLRTVDDCELMEMPVGLDPEGTVTTEYLMDEIQLLISYKLDGSRVENDYPEGLSFLKYDPSGQMYDLGKGISLINSDGSREVILDDLRADEIELFDIASNRAVAAYFAESFTVGKQLMLLDTASGKEISVLEVPWDAPVYSVGDYIVASYNPDAEFSDKMYSVFKKDTGELAGTYINRDQSIDYNFSSNGNYGIVADSSGDEESLALYYFRVSDGAVGTLPLDVPEAAWAISTDITSADRFISAVVIGDPEEGGTRVKLVMSDPEQVKYDGALEKTDPYKYPEEKHHKCGEQFKELRAEADKIEEQYGVKILIGDEVLDLEGTQEAYDIVSDEDEYADEAAIDVTDGALIELEDMLGRYPEGFFEQFKINGKGGLCIALVYSLPNKDAESSFSAGGVTFPFGAWEIIAMRSSNIEPYTAATIHHEMLHAVEDIINRKVGEINDFEWNELNPEDFTYIFNFDEYSNGTISSDLTYGSDDDPYFYYTYSKVNSMEDRATLIEALFLDAYAFSEDDSTYIEDVISKYPHLKAKYEYLAKWVSQLFGYVYWEEMLDIKL
ncbi:MAG: hypothetical protein IKP95_08830 [Ruminococcus sp.]|nr:hypothetical protein [Ruminococcus sp.]